MENNKADLPEVNASAKETESGSRHWGTFGCVGTAYNEVIANFYTDGKGDPVTVVVPKHVENLVLMALEHKLTVLASFNKNPLSAYATITDIIIYN